jgi:peptidoglycan LD-endopeptidase CwlK
MRDSVSLQRANLLHPAIREEVISMITHIENSHFPPTVQIRIIQGLRTIKQQEDLYAQGRTKPGKIVTNARGGQSIHNYGLALDFALMYDKDKNGSFEILSWSTGEDFDGDKISDWSEVVKAFKSIGFVWGGDWVSFKDYPHLEKSFGFGWRDLLKRHTDKDFISGTSYVRL